MLKNGETLDWMEGFQKQNSAEQTKVPSEGKAVTAAGAVEEAGENTAATEHSKLSEQDKVQWLTDRLTHGVTDLIRTRPDQTSSGTADKGRWVKVTVAVGEETDGGVERQRLATDSDVLTLEQPGRVTG